ncbi:PIG-L deacetylase family protein [Nitrosococcus watsonii]|uniref:LmbE family protein n=1 Tax=Nitrosococcus watsoni (strain C-113) TaxID=105559 RepID=D8K5J2_NITWC|nr:PIG-L family deacetylase [Nitrosococcus watsonii]ADJ28169.1 LmbE family protein [Nitrosococcus watsonii C-113]
MNQTLIISAHPDDMEIGMGGTAAKKAASGCHITSVILTDGRRSPNPFGWPEETLVDIRKQEATRAAGVLGINEVIFFDLPDLKNTSHYHSAKDQLSELIMRLQPEEVYSLHDHWDRHPTHRLAGQLTRKCIEETPLSINALWAYEVWGLFPRWDRLEYIDDQIGKKMQAIGEHKSQLASIPYGEGILGLNRWRAVFADPQQNTPQGVFAEVFFTMKL